MALAIGDVHLGWFGREEARAEPDIAGLVRTFNPLLYRVAYSIVRNPAEAEDIVQETFLRVLEHRTHLAEIREIRPWLVRIAWNLALDRKRRKRPGQIDEYLTATLTATTAPADQTLHEATEVAAVLAAIDRLPTAERDCLLLSAIDELTTAEIAVILKRTESSIRSLLFRARTHLKQRLEGRR